MERISAFLADWQVLFREGIHLTLSGEEDIDVIGEATDNEEALNSIESNPPRIAVLNSNRGNPSGIELTHRIKQNLPSVAIVLTTDSDDEEQLLSAMKAGANAYVTKDIDPDELVSIIRKAAQGAYPISKSLLKPEIASRIIDEFEVSALISKEAGDLLARLTPHEGEILRHLADGNSIEQLTLTLGINEGAIGRHLEHIIAKLVANDQNREVIAAAQSNLPETISRAKPDKPAVEYITKDEFTEFKQSITERLKSYTGESG